MDIYTNADWERDNTLSPRIGQYVAEDIINELANCLPPKTWTSGTFQPGEAYKHDRDFKPLFMTFIADANGWQYRGLQHAI